MRWNNDTKDNSGAREDDSNNDVAELVKHEGNENDTGPSAYVERVSPLYDWLKRRKRKKKEVKEEEYENQVWRRLCWNDEGF